MRARLRVCLAVGCPLHCEFSARRMQTAHEMEARQFHISSKPSFSAVNHKRNLLFPPLMD